MVYREGLSVVDLTVRWNAMNFDEYANALVVDSPLVDSFSLDPFSFSGFYEELGMVKLITSEPDWLLLKW